MTDLREAAKLALEALEYEAKRGNDNAYEAERKALKRALAEDAIDILVEREELRAVVAEKLSAVVTSFLKDRRQATCPTCASLMEQNTELDKKLSEWVGLTEEDFFELAPVWFERETSLIDFVAMVEAKLKERNT